MESAKTFTGLFFARLPQFDDLEAFEAAVEVEDGDSRNYSSIQPRCCRELIFTEERILLSPSLKERNQIVIIAQKDVKTAKGFLDLLDKLNVQILRSVDFTKSLFQYCLIFTLNQKLAPLWNKVGEFFVQGRDFLTDTGKLKAVRFDISITDKLSLALEALNIKLIPSKPEHFCSAANTMARFQSDPLYDIHRLSIEDSLCYVLPSLKRGHVVGISRKLPSDGVFSNYEAIRKHWKVMYGWRLPVNESIFYSVEFYNLPQALFTYPGTCVRNCEPVVTYRCVQQEIFASFIQDLHNRMPKVFGVPLRFTVSPLYPSSKLYSGLCANQSNLTRTAPQLKNCRQFEFGKATLSGVDDQPTCRVKSTDSGGTSRQTFTTSNVATRTASPGEESTGVTTPAAKRNRIIPSFTSFTSQSFTKGKHLTIQRSFKKSITAPSSCSVSSKPTNSFKRKDISNLLEKSKNVPTSGLDKENADSVKRSKSVKNTLRTSSLHSTVDVGGLSSMLDREGTCTVTGRFAQNVIREVTTTNSDEQSAIFESTETSSFAEKGILENISVRNLNGAQKPLNSDSCCALKTTNAFNKTNNVQQNSDTGGQILKNGPRNKPRVQQNIDVKEYALNNKLNKVNATTLSQWLKEKGVAVKSKDKKMDLIEKVMQYLGVSQHEL